MAKNYTIKELTDFSGADIMRVGTSTGIDLETFKSMVVQANAYARSRYERTKTVVEREGLPTPLALAEQTRMFDSTRQFSIKENANINELKHQFRVARDFLRSKTSIIGGKRYKEDGEWAVYKNKEGEIIRTKNGKPIYKLTGWKGFIRDVEMRIADKTNINIPENVWNNFWKQYNRVWENKDIRALAQTAYGTSSRVQEIVFQEMQNTNNTGELIKSIKNILKAAYIEEQEEDEDYMSVFESGGSYFNGGSNR